MSQVARKLPLALKLTGASQITLRGNQSDWPVGAQAARQNAQLQSMCELMPADSNLGDGVPTASSNH